MPNEDTPTSPSALDVTKLLAELEIPFPPNRSGGESPIPATTRSEVKSYPTQILAPTLTG